MCFNEEDVEVNKSINIFSVTSTALYSEREVKRGDFEARASISLRIGVGKFNRPAIFSDTTDCSRLTSVSGIPFEDVSRRISVNSISPHNDTSEAIVYPTVRPHQQSGTYSICSQRMPWPTLPEKDT